MRHSVLNGAVVVLANRHGEMTILDEAVEWMRRECPKCGRSTFAHRATPVTLDVPCP